MTSSEGAVFEPETCAWCGGGYGRDGRACGVCRGKGAVMVAQPARKCPVCLCTGRSESSALEPCAACDGSGWEGARSSRAASDALSLKDLFERFSRGE